MGFEYRIRDQYATHFITITVNQWVDVFTRQDYINILIESLKFCQINKGLEIYSWVIMSNHLHLIVSSEKGNLSDIIRDFKKFTSSKIIKAIQNNGKESRKNWLLWLLRDEDKVKLWGKGYHAKEILTKEFMEQKMDYIHSNPVRAGIVEREEHYLNSSCAEIYGYGESILELSDY
ncbi:REP-associated tyrosine transposase [Marinigracilibium pacificum]|uniref:Transposase n=1 Tax=Marinigracilibium pacificum TaxID=2729599 RepID=A0A848IYP0_9BACT|nr:transposase [Marinigracilibium pacificum]NMM48441.1 transposase [Marinigracilibium pacificum]